MGEKRIIRPRARDAAPLPKWTLPLMAASLVVAFIGGQMDAWVIKLLWLPGVVAAFRLALWLEDRVSAPFANARFIVRVGVMAGSLVAGITANVVMGTVLRPVLLSAGFGYGAPLLLQLLVFWFLSATLGGLPVFVGNAFVQTFFDSFRARVQVVCLVLVGMAVGLAVSIAVVGINLVDAIKHDDPHFLVTSDGVAGTAISAQEFRDVYLPWFDNPALIVLVATLIAGLYGIPALISATAKLADAVMERVTPLVDGFDRVANGERDIELEEGGSTELKMAIRRFNALVTSLELGERMERAFGKYVSGQVLELIRARHGDGALPASLRDATVFFADIRGFTTMSERLKPDQVVNILNRYFERVLVIIEAHHGYLNKFIGDAVVVVFNGPIDQPDHAERATRCAIAMQQAVDEMNAACAFPEIGGPLQIGIGISTGPMVCGNIGGTQQMEYTVIGDTVNLAARLTSKAGPGEVWISEPTAGLLPKDLTCVSLEPLHVKGKEIPVKPFKAWPITDTARIVTTTMAEAIA
jgi:class 3 adenylate cyclase